MSNLKDKVILITGGTSGIGEGCTELFARSGAKVVTVSIQEREGTALAERLTAEGHQCIFQFCDVSKESDVKAAVDLAVERFGRLDVVHANAGVLRNQNIKELRHLYPFATYVHRTTWEGSDAAGKGQIANAKTLVELSKRERAIPIAERSY